MFMRISKRISNYCKHIGTLLIKKIEVENVSAKKKEIGFMLSY